MVMALHGIHAEEHHSQFPRSWHGLLIIKQIQTTFLKKKRGSFFHHIGYRLKGKFLKTPSSPPLCIKKSSGGPPNQEKPSKASSSLPSLPIQGELT